MHINSCISHELCGKDKIIIPILQMKKQSDRKRFNLGDLNLYPTLVLTTLTNKNGMSMG